MERDNFMRPIFNLFLLAAIAVEIYSLLNLKTIYNMNTNDMPWWFIGLQVMYSTYAVALFPNKKWWRGGILMAVSVANYAIGDALTVWMQAVDSSICLAVLLTLLLGEILNIRDFNKDNVTKFKVYEYKK